MLLLKFNQNKALELRFKYIIILSILFFKKNDTYITELVKYTF